MQKRLYDGKAFCSRKTAPTLNSHHVVVYFHKTKKPQKGLFGFVVEVVRVELTSYAAAKKLSTYLVYLLFLKKVTRVNTLYFSQEAKYSLSNASH